jgi:hypothetical protein
VKTWLTCRLWAEWRAKVKSAAEMERTWHHGKRLAVSEERQLAEAATSGWSRIWAR